MSENLPPVKTSLSGLRAVVREGKSVMVIQNNMKDKLYFSINREEFVIDTNQLLGILNKLLANEKGEKNEI